MWAGSVVHSTLSKPERSTVWSCSISCCPGQQTPHNLRKVNPQHSRPQKEQQVNYFQPKIFQLHAREHEVVFFRWRGSVQFIFYCIFPKLFWDDTGRRSGSGCQCLRGVGVLFVSVTQVFWQEHGLFCNNQDRLFEPVSHFGSCCSLTFSSFCVPNFDIGNSLCDEKVFSSLYMILLRWNFLSIPMAAIVF